MKRAISSADEIYVSSEAPMLKKLLFPVLLLASASYAAAQYPTPAEGDFAIRNFRFASGETLPELRLHYRTSGAGTQFRNA